ncbi:hypothetical protein PVL29_017815 [Vitis rotundifolia]|uniref:Uncharacterized protein n=1 Tax=Vitis rotundifolia TaxID=103349 RepID=A0AA38Z3H9_VITRO|nr:hypothetical protein PVL29_017815 [Vitis rotundifolia]
MANRRCLRALTLTLTRHDSSIFSSTPPLRSPPIPSPLKTLSHHLHGLPLSSKPSHILRIPQLHWPPHPQMGESSDSEKVPESNCVYSAEDKELEAAAIGCKVVGPLQSSDRVFKSYELVFAAVQIGSHQFKVSNRDCIYTERLKLCEVSDKFFVRLPTIRCLT